MLSKVLRPCYARAVKLLYLWYAAALLYVPVACCYGTVPCTVSTASQAMERAKTPLANRTSSGSLRSTGSGEGAAAKMSSFGLKSFNKAGVQARPMTSSKARSMLIG